MRDYAEKDNRIRVIENAVRLGLAESLNVGLRSAKGEYVARMDAGDTSMPERFSKEVSFLDANPAIGLVGTFQEHFGTENWVHAPVITPEEQSVMLLFHCDICHSTVMFRRELFLAHNLFYDPHCLAEDYELWIRAARHTGIATIPEVLGRYRHDEENITTGKKERLDEESGILTAKQLAYWFDMRLDESDGVLLRSWSNVFQNERDENRREAMLERYREILLTIWERNRTLRIFHDGHLLYRLNTQWCWAKHGGDWKYGPETDTIEAIRDPLHHTRWRTRCLRFNRNHPTFKAKAKWAAKKAIKFFVRPLVAYVDRRNEHMLAAVESRIRKSEGRVLAEIGARISKAEECLLQAAEESARIFAERVRKDGEDMLRTLDGRIWKAEENLLQTIDGRVWKAEENLLQTIDGRVWKAEENILQTIDGRVWKAEENLLRATDGLKQIVDGRVWKAEENILQAVDGRVWKAEESILQTFDGRVWKAEENLQNALRERTEQVERTITEESVQIGRLADGFPSKGHKYLFVNDTFNTFHHGCSATSLAIRRHLCELGDNSTIGISWEAISNPKLAPRNHDEFVSYEFRLKWERENAKLLRLFAASEHIVVNGEGSMSNYHYGSLFLFYLIYYCAEHLKKDVSVINHSLFTTTYSDRLDERTHSDFLKIVATAYRGLKNCWVREPESLTQLEEIVPGRGKLCFDCLPLYVQEIFPHTKQDIERRGVLVGGGNYLDDRYPEFLEALTPVLEDAFGAFEYAFLFSDVPHSQSSGDIALYNRIHELMPDRVCLRSVKTTDEWLDEIRSARLLVSGRFHHTIAAFMLDTPFFAFKTDTKKMEGMLSVVEKSHLLLDHDDAGNIVRVKEFLRDDDFFKANATHIKKKVLNLAMNNFSL
jgi:glycosyltransferase involved in cell wall biosynthesis